MTVSLVKLRNRTIYLGLSDKARSARVEAIWFAFGAERADVQPRGGFAFAFADDVALWHDEHPDANYLPAGMNGAYIEMLTCGQLVTTEPSR